MNWEFTPFAAPLFVGAAVVLLLNIVAVRRFSAPGALPFMAVSLAFIIYAVAYAFEVGSQTVEGVRFWLKVEYLGASTGSALILLLIFSFTGNRRFLQPLPVIALLTLPAITCVLAWTNDQHGLIWQNIRIDTAAGFTKTTFDHGIWYWVNVAQDYLVLVGALTLLAQAFFRATGVFRRQLGIMLAGIAVPFVVFAIYLTGAVFPGLDLNPYGLVITAGLLSWGIFNYQLLDLVPVAREAVFATMRDAVVVFDGKGRLADFNPAAQSLLGTNAKLELGLPFEKVLPEPFHSLKPSDRLPTARIEIALDVAGRQHTIEASMTAFTGSRADRVEGYHLVLRDVTERVHTQNELIVANQQLTTLRMFDAELNRNLSLSYVAMVAIDAAQRLTLADAGLFALEEPGGHRVLHAIGNYPSDIVSQLLPADKGIISRAVANRQPILTLDVSSDQDYVAAAPNMKAQITLPLVSRKKVVGALVLETAYPERFNEEILGVSDLLASRIASAVDNALAYAEVDQLAKELEAFAHTVAHDLKTPLGAMMGYAELEITDTKTHKSKPLAEKILMIARQAVDIVDALLLLARTRTMSDIAVTTVDMAAVVENVAGRLGALITQNKASLSRPDRWPASKGYGPWIEEIWANYISNAIKYGGEPPIVGLGWDPPSDGQVRFWVQDNGKGLSKDETDKLFQPFTRLDDAKRAEGHGLGLSIVQRIAERLGGKAGVESTPGKGSKFYFTLPSVD
jgi:PAS domain S-box-containing protein